MQIQIALDLKSYTDSELVVESNLWTRAILASPYFTGFTADTNQVVSLTGGFNTFITTHRKGDLTGTKTTLRTALETALTSLGMDVQKRVNNPVGTEAPIVIAEASSMTLKGKTSAQKHKFSVSKGDVSGTEHLFGQGEVPAHEWRMAAATAPTVFYRGRTTTAAHTTLPDSDTPAFVIGQKYLFWHRAVHSIPRGVTVRPDPPDWEGPIEVTIV